MSLISILADCPVLPPPIDRNTAVQTRIAEALERLSPPPPVMASDLAGASLAARPVHVSTTVSICPNLPKNTRSAPIRSRPGYLSRRSSWSPAFQDAILSMRNGLMRPTMW